MLRSLHRWPGLLAAILLVALSLSGGALSVLPAVERAMRPTVAEGQTVAQLVAMVLAAHPTVEQIRRAPSGRITAYWFDDVTPGAAVFDPITGKDAGSADVGAVQRWLTSFHRSLLLGDGGRIAVAGAALAMLVLALSGAMLVASRVGGWRKWFVRLRGPLAGRLHTELARVAVLALLVSATTGMWMAASTFDLLPVDEANPASPMVVSGEVGLAPTEIAVFRDTPVTALRDLTFPYAGDVTDVYTLTTQAGTGYVDQGDGTMLAWDAPGAWTLLGEWIYLLHTGEGAALWGLLLGALILSVPALAVTGTLVWLQGRRSSPVLRGMVSASQAETVILVGSEGGSTWGFATALGAALNVTGHGVHLAPLSAFAPSKYVKAKRLVVMTATWGDGAAPASAKGALERLAAALPLVGVPMAVLGFGDRSFPAFCAFAEAFAAKAGQTGWHSLLPLGQIDRQSAQAFGQWVTDFANAIEQPLQVTYVPAHPKLYPLTLVSRRDYGEAVQTPTAILRFAKPKQGMLPRLLGRGFGRYQAGDLLGILPEGSVVPRFYSLASGNADGFIEIVVRKQSGGLCSGQLLALQPGQSMHGFPRANPGFHAGRGSRPLILIGAGTGIGPLAGFLRGNSKHRPMYLWFGARHPDADLLYAEDLAQWTKDGRLHGLHTAFSRLPKRRYVQDSLREDAEMIRGLVARGAQVMVCGGRDMAQGVQAALAEILQPSGMTPALLKAEGRYAEDVY